METSGKVWKVICAIIVMLNIFIVYRACTREKTEDVNEYITKIDSLEAELAKIENKKDSINKEIDTVYIKLKVVEKEYEEKYNDILFNSTSDDYLFFTEYVERYDSINNR